MNLKKILAAFILTIFVIGSMNSQTVDAENESESSDDTDDFDSLFAENSDTEEPVTTEPEKAKGDVTFNVGEMTMPLLLSGSMEAELGADFIRKDEKNDGSAYFKLINYIRFASRFDNNLSVRGSFKTSIPEADEANEDNQNHYFYLYEFYFDYILWDRVYITGGKKTTVWGNIRLFSSDDNYEDDTDALYTNVLTDSRYNISGIVRLPWQHFNFSGIVMYRGDYDSPNYKDMSYAANAELVFFNTSLSAFGRLFPQKTGNNSSQYQEPIWGAEFKRTILSVDLYCQEMGRLKEPSRLENVKRGDWRAFSKLIFTGGFYKYWADNPPYFGINGEFQNIYIPDTDSYTNRSALEVGVSKLGKDRKLKIGVQWLHNYTEKSGYVKFATVFSRIFPHCDWNNGVKWEYSDAYEVGKFTFGSYLRITLDY